MQDFVSELLHLYRGTPALYSADCVPEGFEWINADDADRSIYSFLRHSADGKSNLLFVINFTPMARPDYRVGRNALTPWSWTAMRSGLADTARRIRKSTRLSRASATGNPIPSPLIFRRMAWQCSSIPDA